MPKTACVGWPGGPGHQRDGVEDLVDQGVGVEDVEVGRSGIGQADPQDFQRPLDEQRGGPQVLRRRRLQPLGPLEGVEWAASSWPGRT